MKAIILSATFALLSQANSANNIYKYEGCEYKSPIKVQIASDYPGLKGNNVQLNSKSIYEVTLRGNHPNSRESDYVLIKDAQGELKKIRTDWLKRDSAKAVYAADCEKSDKFQKRVNKVDMSEGLRDAKSELGSLNICSEAAQSVGKTGIYNICAPLRIVDTDDKEGNFNSLKCAFLKVDKSKVSLGPTKKATPKVGVKDPEFIIVNHSPVETELDLDTLTIKKKKGRPRYKPNNLVLVDGRKMKDVEGLLKEDTPYACNVAVIEKVSQELHVGFRAKKAF